MLTARRILQAFHRDERGQSAFFVVLMLLVVFAFFAFALDAGLWYADHRKAQNQAEAAAHAGALELPNTAAAATAVDQWLVKNGSSVAQKCGMQVTASFVRVCVRRHSSPVFSALAGVDTVWVSAAARADRVAVKVPYSLMAMNQTLCGTFSVQGSVLVNITGVGETAGTYTRSSCSTTGNNAGSLQSTGSARLVASGLNDIVGTASTRCVSGAGCTPVPTAQAFLEDPFASVPVPPISGCVNGNLNVNNTQNLGPFCRNGSINLTGTLNLSPGVYIIRGGLSVTGSGRITGSGVLLYITCNPSPCNGNVPAPFSISGTSSFQLSGHSGYNNLTIFVDRTAGVGNNNAPVVDITGTASSTLSGGVYAISTIVRITGNGGTKNLNIAIVADRLLFAGNGTINVTYDLDLIPPFFELAVTE
jgi:Putative Flp pilus-assembly TadE/G-like